MNRKTIASYPVPTEPLWDVFTPHVIGELQKVSMPDSWIDFRLRVLRAGGLNDAFQNRELRAYKAAWETYLIAAFGCGLFEGPHGIDLRARLTGIDGANFRSALSECFAVWYLAGKLKLKIKPRPKGQGDSNLEFAIKLGSGDIKVEVKAPYRPRRFI